MQTEGLIAYFGYGSLVNRATLRTEIVHAVPARLSGWRRSWRPRPDMPGFPAALLTVRAEEGASVDGLLVFDRAENLPAVDRREAHYDRKVVTHDRLASDHVLPEGLPVFVYEARAEIPFAEHEPPILQSYLDAVLQGFLIEHGASAVARFIAETENFHLPILRDRDAPIYPRSVMITPDEQAMFDRLLEDAGMRYVEAAGDGDPPRRETGTAGRGNPG